MCSLFSPSPMPNAESQGTKNFGTVSAERHEDCHCLFPFLEWGSYHVHPQREDAGVSQQHCSRCPHACRAVDGVSPAASAAAATGLVRLQNPGAASEEPATASHPTEKVLGETGPLPSGDRTRACTSLQVRGHWPLTRFVN